MTAVFYQDETQKRLAEKTRDREAARRKQRIATAVLPLTDFYLAEGYHQKYFLKQRPELLKELRASYPDEKDFLASTAVARVNGYVGGFGKQADLDREIGRLGLSSANQQVLRRVWQEHKHR
jgi:peptide-methionine (S)-S-oxide reductase